jgi:hypothetical protein
VNVDGTVYGRLKNIALQYLAVSHNNYQVRAQRVQRLYEFRRACFFRLEDTQTALLREAFDRRGNDLTSPTLWSVRLRHHAGNLMVAADKRFQRLYGEIRRTEEYELQFINSVRPARRSKNNL